MTDDLHRQVAAHARAVRESADHLEDSAGAVVKSTDRTTVLAADRTVLAAERTYAAWVRTGLAALASGVGAKALFNRLLPDWFGGVTGSVLVAFSAFCFVAAVWRQLDSGAPPPEPDTRRLPKVILLGVTGFLILVDIATLVAIWVARGDAAPPLP